MLIFLLRRLTVTTNIKYSMNIFWCKCVSGEYFHMLPADLPFRSIILFAYTLAGIYVYISTEVNAIGHYWGCWSLARIYFRIFYSPCNQQSSNFSFPFLAWLYLTHDSTARVITFGVALSKLESLKFVSAGAGAHLKLKTFYTTLALLSI